MNSGDFFKLYIPALEIALSKDNEIENFSIKCPDWWYPKDKYSEMDIFDDENYNKYPLLNMAALYFDAKAHNFDSIDGINIDIYKKQLINLMQQYKVQYNT